MRLNLHGEQSSTESLGKCVTESKYPISDEENRLEVCHWRVELQATETPSRTKQKQGF